MARFWKIGIGLVLFLTIASGTVLFGLHLNRQLDKKQRQVDITKADQEAEQNSVLGKAKSALRSNLQSADSLATSYDATTKTLTIIDEENPSQGIDQQLFSLTPERLVQIAFSTFVYGGMAAFKVDGIDKLTVIQKVPLDSGAGTVVITDIVKLSASKDKFLSVDWTQLVNKPIYPQIKQVADNFYIEPRIGRSINSINAILLVPS